MCLEWELLGRYGKSERKSKMKKWKKSDFLNFLIKMTGEKKNSWRGIDMQTSERKAERGKTWWAYSEWPTALAAHWNHLGSLKKEQSWLHLRPIQLDALGLSLGIHVCLKALQA